MRLLLVQLSDIHLRSSDNAIIEKRSAIVRALQNVDTQAIGCLVVVSGDIAFSGSGDEYYLALEFIAALQSELRQALHGNIPVYVAAIPGNHDCDFAEPMGVRDLLRAQLNVDPSQKVDESVIDIGTRVQRGFFELRDALDEGSSNLALDGKLYYEYRFVFDDATIEIRCLNSSWLSQLHETEGTLHFPVEVIPGRNAGAAVTVSMLHHPFAWFNTTVRRDLQKKLETVSDIILTGHEHVETRRSQTLSTGETNQFIEGGALQTNDASESEFNVLIIDTNSRQQRFLRFQWKGEMYMPAHDGDWEPFQVNKLRARQDFEPTADFCGFLEDPGANFEKAGVGRPTLSQLFVYPELRRVSLKGLDGSQGVASEAVFDSLEPPNLLISGAEQSGKTSLAKSIFARLRQQGFVPLYINGSEFSPQRDERLHEQLHRLFVQQYGPSSAEKYRQLERTRRVLIIDNFHRVRLKAGEAERLLEGLERFAGRVFLFTNDLAHAFGEILRAGAVIEERSTYDHYRVMPFGYAKRIELTTQWLTLGGQLEEELLAQKLTEAEDRMEVVLGKNFVPAFPIFLLALLQGLETASQSDVVASTYGYFYEIFIKATLAKGSTNARVNIRYTYLTHLAWHLYKSGKQEITEDEFEEFHANHVKTYDLKLGFRDITEDLRDRLVLWHHSDSYGFKYQYFYYYFVARYINVRLNVDRPGITEVIDDLAANLAVEEKANVLLFVVHLSPDPMIVEKMIATASAQFADCEIAKLEDDVAFLNEYATNLAELDFEDRPFTENRKAIAVHRDRVEYETGEHAVRDKKLERRDEEFEEAQRMLLRLLTGLKTLQILGQVLKNHPASFVAELKERTAIECYSLGFRVLGYMVSLLREGRNELVEQAIEAIREERPDENDERVVRLANSVVFGLGLLGSFGIIKRIGNAVGSPELMLTYAKVHAAMPFLSTRLANMSIRLDGAGFPTGELLQLAADIEGGVLAKDVLKWLVFSHVNLFPTNFRDRQRVFQAVGITYRDSIGANPHQKLLGPGRR
jgi:hypothetical protein